MRANALPIGDNPVLTIGADRCVDIGCLGFPDWSRIGNGLADYQQVVRLVLDRYWIGRLE